MKVDAISTTSFQYHHPLKTQWLKGNMPTVKYGLYGERLTPKTVSLEHLTPVSQGGKTTLGNLALADKKKNNDRGTEFIGKFLTIEMVKNYCRQFKDINLPDFNGNEYIRLMKKYFGGLL